MKKIEIQQDNIKQLLQLIAENPELEIIPMVSTECVGGDEYSWWSAEWGKAEIDEYYTSDERIYLKSTDSEDLVEEYIDIISGESEIVIPDESLQEMAEFRVDSLEWVKAIMVHIEP